MEKFDVVVVGAGTGGCLAAWTVAKSGLKVCLLDLKRADEIGKKVCGDGIGKHHFDNLGLKYPSGDELEREIKGALIFSPNKKSVFRVCGGEAYGFTVNRHLFGQRLLKRAIDEGAVLYDMKRVFSPVIKDGRVVGVKVKDLRSGSIEEFYGDVTIEASGMNAVIRRKLPPELGIEKEPDIEDVIVCYREIRELREPLSPPDHLQIYLNMEVAPGGYFWIFPEGGNKVNVGLGISMKGAFPNPKVQLYRKVLSQDMFKGSKILDRGGGTVPVRRPLDKIVSDGLMLVGDAAFQVNPLHGGGIGPSMMAGKISGEVAVKAIEAEDTRMNGLWAYPVEYIRSYGAKQAGLDVFRRFLQRLDDEDLNYGMKNLLITEEDVLAVSMGGKVNLNISQKVIRLFRGIGKLGLINSLRRTASLLNEVKAHYMQFPDRPEDFERWRVKTLRLVEKAKTTL